MPEPLTYRVTGMRCAACASGLQARASEQPGVQEAEADFATRRLRVVPRPEDFDPGAFQDRIEEAGFVLSSPRERAPEEESPAAPLWLLALLGVPVLAAEHGLISLPGGSAALVLLATSVQVLGGAEFYAGARRALRAGHPNMDVLVALGITAAYGFALASWWLPGLGSGPARFEAAVMLILFIRFGRDQEARLRLRARSAVDMLASRQQEEVCRLKDDGSEHRLPPEGLRKGDRVRIRPGERVPADGVILEGRTEVEEALLTGEPEPVPRAEGDEVLAGSTNLGGVVVVEVRRLGEETTFERITRMAEEGLARKPALQRRADRLAAVFVPVVVTLALLTLVAWLVLTGDPARAITAATAVVVVACPCALGLATPTAVMVASGAALEHGLLFGSGEALEALADLDVVAFDKTGTLTEGRFQVGAVLPAPGSDLSPEALLQLAASLEAGSRHPLARAVVAASDPAPGPRAGVEEHPGRGLSAPGDGGTLRIGRRSFLAEHGVPDSALDSLEEAAPDEFPTHLLLARDAALLGLVALGDRLRPGAAEVVRALQAAGPEVVLLSGDRPAAAERVAGALGISARGGLLPEDKLAWVEEQEAAGRRVAFVGDGLNDGPALARATVGIAMGGGTDLTRRAGDLVLLDDRLEVLPRALRLARATVRKIRQNLGLALVYNLLALPLAAGVLYPWTGTLLPPHLAGLAMALSSVTVVSSSLLLRREGR